MLVGVDSRKNEHVPDPRVRDVHKHSFDNQMTTQSHPKPRSASPTLYGKKGSKNMWMRSCAVCKALLKKLSLRDSIRCQCGWEWLGH
jgi:hypothetical protein